ncbi:MAG: hypothetical protein WDW38_001290 [Sanguina aurantia]
MKSLQLNGPWAHFERQNSEAAARILQLEAEVKHWQQATQLAESCLEGARRENELLMSDEIPELRGQNERAKSVINQLHDEVALANADGEIARRQLAAQVESLTMELGKLSSDTLVLRAELAKSVHVKANTSHKLEAVRQKLGLTESEAKVFVAELDDLRASVKRMRSEISSLSSDKAALQQQVDSRSQHCMTLISENKRALAQASEVRQQVAGLQTELSDSKRELRAAGVALLQRKPLVCKEKAEWQGTAGKTKAKSPAALERDQNRAPWMDQGSRSSTPSPSCGASSSFHVSASSSRRSPSSGGGKESDPQMSRTARISASSLVQHPSTFKLAAVREALALRLGRMESAHPVDGLESGRQRGLLQQAQSLAAELRSLPMDIDSTRNSYPRMFDLARLAKRFVEATSAMPHDQTRAMWEQRGQWLQEEVAALAQERVHSADQQQHWLNLVLLLFAAADACDSVLREKVELGLMLQDASARVQHLEGQLQQAQQQHAQQLSVQAASVPHHVAEESLSLRAKLAVAAEQAGKRSQEAQTTAQQVQLLTAERERFQEQVDQMRVENAALQETADKRIEVIQQMMTKHESSSSKSEHLFSDNVKLQAQCKSLSINLETNSQVITKLIELNSELMEALNRSTAAKDVAAAAAAAAGAAAAAPASHTADSSHHRPRPGPGPAPRRAEPAPHTSGQAPAFGTPPTGHPPPVRGTLAHAASADGASTGGVSSAWPGNNVPPRDQVNRKLTPAPQNGPGVGSASDGTASLTDAFEAFLRSGEDGPAGGRGGSPGAAARTSQAQAHPGWQGPSLSTATAQTAGVAHGWAGEHNTPGPAVAGSLDGNGASGNATRPDAGSQAMLTLVEAGGSRQPRGLGAGTGKVLRGLARYVVGNVQPQVAPASSVNTPAASHAVAPRTQQTAVVEDAG